MQYVNLNIQHKPENKENLKLETKNQNKKPKQKL